MWDAIDGQCDNLSGNVLYRGVRGHSLLPRPTGDRVLLAVPTQHRVYQKWMIENAGSRETPIYTQMGLCYAPYGGLFVIGNETAC